MNNETIENNGNNLTVEEKKPGFIKKTKAAIDVKKAELCEKHPKAYNVGKKILNGTKKAAVGVGIFTLGVFTGEKLANGDFDNFFSSEDEDLELEEFDDSPSEE